MSVNQKIGNIFGDLNDLRKAANVTLLTSLVEGKSFTLYYLSVKTVRFI